MRVYMATVEIEVPILFASEETDKKLLEIEAREYLKDEIRNNFGVRDIVFISITEATGIPDGWDEDSQVYGDDDLTAGEALRMEIERKKAEKEAKEKAEFDAKYQGKLF